MPLSRETFDTMLKPAKQILENTHSIYGFHSSYPISLFLSLLFFFLSTPSLLNKCSAQLYIIYACGICRYRIKCMEHVWSPLKIKPNAPWLDFPISNFYTSTHYYHIPDLLKMELPSSLVLKYFRLLQRTLMVFNLFSLDCGDLTKNGILLNS